jgi:sulfatase maturation enzyme AslB (radical SAM superfamily)
VKKKHPDFTIDTNTVLNRYNKNNIKVLFKFLSYFPITRIQLIQLYSLNLFSQSEKKDLYVSYDDFEEELNHILALKNIDIVLENFPFCKVDPKHWKYIEQRQRYNNDAYGALGD